MLDEFARELANVINDLTRYTHQLEAWAATVEPLSAEEKLDATHQFIDVLATTAVNLPYVIRSRFIFATAHLCHQANITKNPITWIDDLPLDGEIYFDTADRAGAGWRKYNPLKRGLENIAGKSYREATHDFRNAYNHRFSPRFVVGITRLVSRRKHNTSGQAAYEFGGMPALELTTVAALLVQQRDHSYAAFEAFQKLAHEHERAIFAFRPH